MNPDPQTIDRIVAEVLKRLREGGPSARPRPVRAPPAVATPPAVAADSPSRPVSPAHGRPTSAPDCLTIEHRVVTLSAVEGRLEGIRRVSTPEGAVITPSVRDELRKRGITMDVRATTSTGAVPAVGVVLVSGCEKVRRAAERLVGGRATISVMEEDPLQAIERLTSELLDPDRMIVLFTDQVPLLVCRANRSNHVRAVAAHRTSDVRQGREQLEANLWVVNPRWVEPGGWRRMWPMLTGATKG